MGKRYLSPTIELSEMVIWETPFCESTGALSPLEESSDMEDLGWN